MVLPNIDLVYRKNQVAIPVSDSVGRVSQKNFTTVLEVTVRSGPSAIVEKLTAVDKTQFIAQNHQQNDAEVCKICHPHP